MNLPEILSALAHEHPGEQAHARMAPSPKIIPGIEGIHHRPPIPSAVMVLLSPENNDWNLLLIRRSNQGKYHGGQIAFPGGKIEESDPDKQSAALRECQEEIGVSPQHINIVSTLSDIYIPLSNFNITPYVGTIPKMPNFVLSPNEVDEVIPVSLQQILDDRNKTVRTIFRNNHEIKARGYQIGENFIWGATAMIIAELETLLKHEV